MADTENLASLFAPTSSNGLPPDIFGVLESTQRLHSISAQELFFKWESYCLKMGSEETKLDLNTARMFQKDVQDSLERGGHEKHLERNSTRKTAIAATPRAPGSAGDIFGMLDELTPNTLPRRTGSVKRKADFDTPMPRKVSRPETKVVSRTAQKTGPGLTEGIQVIPFAERPNAGQTVESLNNHLPTAEVPIAPFAEPRIKVVANSEIKKFSYKPMSMRLAESSEIHDERIDDFLALVQKHHNLEDSVFGNPASQSTNEIVAVGRISSDTSEGKLNAASIVLETSRRMGAGLRVPLKIDALTSYQFFPGQIVAVRGTNASGHYFSVSEILSLPQLPVTTSPPHVLQGINEKLDITDDANANQPLNIIFASGPYTAETDLNFEPLHVLCTKATEAMADALILIGPFLDIEHPMLAKGDFDLPDIKLTDTETTMSTLFRLWISTPIARLCAAVPSITVIMVPSVRDAVSKHVSWPQEQLPRKDLGLPKQVKMLPNPSFVSLNETVVAISSQDILYELSREQISGGTTQGDLMTRLPRCLIEQRHFFPLFPPLSRDKLIGGTGTKATGACLDLGYIKLAEWMQFKPDVLVIPSSLTPTVKVVDSVMVINSGTLSKRRGPGTYAQMWLQSRLLSEAERGERGLPHKIFERARVDIVRI